MKPFRLVEDPQISHGGEPRNGERMRRILTGWPALSIIATEMKNASPDNARRVYTIERAGFMWHVRVWLCNSDSTSAIWFSVGYSVVPLHRWVLIWIRAAFRRRQRDRDRPDGLPPARTVQR